jgi:hypothetical protein
VNPRSNTQEPAIALALFLRLEFALPVDIRFFRGRIRVSVSHLSSLPRTQKINNSSQTYAVSKDYFGFSAPAVNRVTDKFSCEEYCVSGRKFGRDMVWYESIPGSQSTGLRDDLPTVAALTVQEGLYV